MLASGDSRYIQQVDKALKAFEGTSRWPDLVYALSRLLKVCDGFTLGMEWGRRVSNF